MAAPVSPSTSAAPIRWLLTPLAEHDSARSIQRLLGMVGLLWLAYLLALALGDRLYAAAEPRVAALPLVYYVGQALAALLVLGLGAWPARARAVDRWRLPLGIGCIALLPMLITVLLRPQLPAGPMTSAEGLALRLLPVLLMGLILVAAHYGWRQVIMFSLGTTLLSLAPGLLRGGPARSLSAPESLTAMIQAMSFLTLGSWLWVLMETLRGQRAALATANDQLRQAATTLEELTVSRERNRMARELHDTLAHTLSSLSVYLETTKAYWERDPDSAGPMLDTALSTTRSGLEETRRALKALRAAPLEAVGLRLALRLLAEDAADRAQLSTKLDLADALPALPAELEQALYRIAQEAVTNVVRHAQAQHLSLQLQPENDHLMLVVRDDGCGFELEAEPPSGHFGLRGMHERAALAGFELELTSSPGHGTTVYCKLRGPA